MSHNSHWFYGYWLMSSSSILTCLMLFVINQTMNIREHTWTPVTITDVRTIPLTHQKQQLKNIFIYLE